MPTNPMVIAIIAAAGQGTRLGADLPKAYVELAGQTLMERSVRAMIDAGVDHIIVVIMPAMEETARRILADYPDVQLVHGAGERVDSVWRGIQAIPTTDDDAVVLIHDSARALTPPDMIRRVAQAITGDVRAVIPVLPVADTIKRVADTVVVDTPARADLRIVQTPQAFRLGTLREANQTYFRDPSFVVTDDASLVEHLNIPVHCVPGDPLAMKITTPIDLTLAAALL